MKHYLHRVPGANLVKYLALMVLFVRIQAIASDKRSPKTQSASIAASINNGNAFRGSNTMNGGFIISEQLQQTHYVSFQSKNWLNKSWGRRVHHLDKISSGLGLSKLILEMSWSVLLFFLSLGQPSASLLSQQCSMVKCKPFKYGTMLG
jgi:hypothetical protein